MSADSADAHNTILTFGYVLARAASPDGSVSMLDWGGGVGHYFRYAQALLPELEIEYHCKDVPVLAEAGRGLVQGATFHDDDSCLDRTYDLVMASGSLQYSASWKQYLERLGQAASRFLYVTRLPVVQQSATFAMCQRAHRFGYPDLTGWVLNQCEFLQAAETVGLPLIREFVVNEQFRVRGSDEIVRMRGFLFAPPVLASFDTGLERGGRAAAGCSSLPS